MTRDEQAVVHLLRSLYDWVPGPRTSTGAIVARGALPGEGGSLATRDCPRCAGKGERRERGIPRRCENCGGSGTLTVDAYTQRELVGEQKHDDLASELRAHFAAMNRDEATKGAIRYEHGQRAERESARLLRLLEEGAEGDVFTAASAAHDRYREHGDYRELERCLDLLRRYDRGAYASILAVHVLDVGLRTIGPRLAARAAGGVSFLAEWMRKPIRVPPWIEEAERRAEQARRKRSSEWYGKQARHEQARGPRNAEIRARAANGETAGHIARGMGLTKRRVEQIVASGMPGGAMDEEGVATFRL